MAHDGDLFDYSGGNFDDVFANPGFDINDYPVDDPMDTLESQFDDDPDAFLFATIDPQLQKEQDGEASEAGAFITNQEAAFLQQYRANDPSLDADNTAKSRVTSTKCAGDVSLMSSACKPGVNPPSVKRKRGPNKNKKVRTKEEEEKKHTEFLHRNKVAAAKCRNRKKAQHDALLARASKYEAEKQQLVAQRTEIEELLQNLIHQSREAVNVCNDPAHKTALMTRINTAEAVIHSQHIFNAPLENFVGLSMLTEGRSQSVQSDDSRISGLSGGSKASSRSKLHDSGISGMSESPKSFEDGGSISSSTTAQAQMTQQSQAKILSSLEGMTDIDEFLRHNLIEAQ